MKHLKRHKAPKRWPIARKGTTFVVSPNFSPKRGVPILIILRDMLKICQNRKEVKKVLHDEKVLLNGRKISSYKNPALLFDVVSVVPAKKHYRISLSERGKYVLDEIPEKDAGKKVTKVVNKKVLRGKKTQLNLRDGNNFISDMKCNVGDSILIDLKNKKIEKCLGLKEKANVIVVEGKHAGKKGILEKMKLERKMAKLNIDGNEVNVLIKQIMVVE